MENEKNQEATKNVNERYVFFYLFYLWVSRFWNVCWYVLCLGAVEEEWRVSNGSVFFFLKKSPFFWSSSFLYCLNRWLHCGVIVLLWCEQRVMRVGFYECMVWLIECVLVGMRLSGFVWRRNLFEFLREQFVPFFFALLASCCCLLIFSWIFLSFFLSILRFCPPLLSADWILIYTVKLRA